MPGVGYRKLGGKSQFGTRVSANGTPHWKTGGITIDWSKVAAASGSDTTLLDGMIVPAGYQFLRYGQCMAEITQAGTYTVTVTATSGTYVLTVTNPITLNETDTAAIAENAAAATVQTALEDGYGAGNVSVSGSAGGPYTVTLIGALAGYPADPPVVKTNGTDGTVVLAETAEGGVTGDYGPYDPAASDGRQATPANGAFGILDRTIIRNFPTAADADYDDEHVGLIVGGRLFKERVIMTTGTHSLAAGPTVTEVESALKTVEWARF